MKTAIFGRVEDPLIGSKLCPVCDASSFTIQWLQQRMGYSQQGELRSPFMPGMFQLGQQLAGGLRSPSLIQLDRTFDSLAKCTRLVGCMENTMAETAWACQGLV